MYFKKIPRAIQFLFPSILWSAKGKKEFKLTFDDGPHPESTPYILDALEKKNIKATFFCLGENLEKYPLLKKQILDNGHLIANHGYNHLSGWSTDTDVYVENALAGATFSGSKLYRPPYGKMTIRQYRLLNRKFQIVLWTYMPGDFDNSISKEVIKKKVKEAYSKDEIIVLHDKPHCLSKILFAIEDLPKCA